VRLARLALHYHLVSRRSHIKYQIIGLVHRIFADESE
jgi:hypothetical protein